MIKEEQTPSGLPHRKSQKPILCEP